jgi:hypothetical protein
MWLIRDFGIRTRQIVLPSIDFFNIYLIYGKRSLRLTCELNSVPREDVLPHHLSKVNSVVAIGIWD